jgi:hypothetical protein
VGILTRVVVHVLQHVRNRSLTLSVDAASEFANQTDLLVVTQPLGGGYKTLGTNGGRDAVGRCTRAVSVEIPKGCQHCFGRADVLGALLVHLVDQFVLWVSERSHQVTV